VAVGQHPGDVVIGRGGLRRRNCSTKSISKSFLVIFLKLIFEGSLNKTGRKNFCFFNRLPI
jgi:hypothetical protein